LSPTRWSCLRWSTNEGDPATAAEYRRLIDGRSVVISFVTVTEVRYGALKANWGELRRRELERTPSKLVAVQPDHSLMTRCAELRDRCERDGVALGQKIHEADRWIAATAQCVRSWRVEAYRTLLTVIRRRHPESNRTTVTPM
jgi:predicted nucleic acid-binding protein